MQEILVLFRAAYRLSLCLSHNESFDTLDKQVLQLIAEDSGKKYNK